MFKGQLVASVENITATRLNLTVDDIARKRWIASHIYPLETRARRWLKRHIRSLSKADMDDLVQEAYARICNVDIARIQTPATYLYVTLRNLLIERARHSRVIPLERLGEIDQLSIPLDELSPDRRVSARQELEQLGAMVTGLPQQCRRVFELRKLEGLSQRETAGALGISERTVEKHLAKAFVRVMEMRRLSRGTEASEMESTTTTDEKRRERD